MDLTTNLQITQKGEDEVKRRVFKLNMKKRSVLILLDKPKPIQLLLAKSVFPQNEIIEEIEALLRDGFVSLCGVTAPEPIPPIMTAAAPAVAPGMASASGIFHLNDEIMLAEAKFMLYDFSVDSFGTKSQAFADNIRACSSVKDLENCLRGIYTATEAKCPNRIPVLLGVIKEINETA
jgi:hypothetical protein